MLKYFKVMEDGELAQGKAAIISVRGKEIALFNYKGKYHAVDNKCPHKGAPLGEGRIEEGVLICPNHEWRFDVENGNCPQNPELNTVIYPVRIYKGAVRIGIDVEDEEVARRRAVGKEEYKVPSELKFEIPTITRPVNEDETL